jgi:opacity protein-like surface antigen
MARIPVVSTLVLSAALLAAAGASAQVLPDTKANRDKGVVGCVQTRTGITCGGRGNSGGGGQYYNNMMNAYNLGMNLGNALNQAMRAAEAQARAAHPPSA